MCMHSDWVRPALLQILVLLGQGADPATTGQLFLEGGSFANGGAMCVRNRQSSYHIAALLGAGISCMRGQHARCCLGLPRRRIQDEEHLFHR